MRKLRHREAESFALCHHLVSFVKLVLCEVYPAFLSLFPPPESRAREVLVLGSLCRPLAAGSVFSGSVLRPLHLWSQIRGLCSGSGVEDLVGIVDPAEKGSSWSPRCGSVG